MFCKTFSASLYGINAVMVQVEADVRNGLPAFLMVGALSVEAREAKERVRVAIENMNYQMPPKRITVNLAPADIRKEGTSFDLPVAISVLAALGYVSKQKFKTCMMTGELGLDGRLNPVKGVLPMACLAAEKGFRELLVPFDNAKEASVVNNISVYGVRTLKEAVEFLNGTLTEKTQTGKSYEEKKGITRKFSDFADIIGQETAKRALTIAAAGGHHLLMIGPPGSGKTALARCLPGILPSMEFEEMLELSKIYSVSGKLGEGNYLIRERPFLAPHHATTMTALIGGGRNCSAGIVSLCHHGILFLDEFTQFRQEVLETLRQPLEERRVTIARLRAACTYPASFQLVAAMNPCLCGAYPDMEKCRCTPAQINHYIGKISQPLLDRMDMTIEVFPVDYQVLRSGKKQEGSDEIRKRVEKARDIQKRRFSGKEIFTNSEMNKTEIEKYCCVDEEGEALLHHFFTTNEASTRSYYRMLKLARTIADLEACEMIKKEHLAEARCYRSVGTKYWSRM